jgi:hypothetical protein
MVRQNFVDQLKTLGYEPQELGNNRLCFQYIVPVGKLIGRNIRIGLEVGDDFPATPPGGLHVSPHLLPLNTTSGVLHPAGGIHNSPFGSDWQYWSRPCPDWAKTDRTVRAYMAFVRHLFETQ